MGKTNAQGPHLSFIYGESLLELAIRIGIADLVADPEEVKHLLGISPGRDLGLDLTPPEDGAPKVFDPTLLDEFQNKIDMLQRLKGEEGLAPIFRNNIPALPDIQEYLKICNIKFSHGYPREAADLPMICIVLGPESEGTKYNGQHKYTPVRQNRKGQAVVRMGSDMDASYEIHVISTNYDEVVILFHIIKYALLKYRDHLEGYGLREATMNWGPCELAPEYLQGGVFTYDRVCNLACVKDESFEYARDGFGELVFNVQADGDTIVSRQVLPPGPEEGLEP